MPEQKPIDWNKGAKDRQKRHREILDEQGFPADKDFDVQLDPKYSPKTESDRYSETAAPPMSDNPQVTGA